MAKAVLPVQAGFDYQAELFWQKACDLFLPHTKTERVEYEVDDQKSFDDVVVTYSAPIPDLYDTYKVKEFFQAKFHSKNTAPILYGSLIDPAYIGATTYSFLQKLLNADRNAADDRYVYTLFSPSSVHPDDALAGVWSNFDGSIDIDGLFVGKTPASGSVENIARMSDPDQRFVLALLQGGIDSERTAPGLMSYGRVFLEPLWVFHTLPGDVDRLTGLAAKRIAIGPPGSGTRVLAENLLAANGIKEGGATLLPLGSGEAVAALERGEADAAFLTLAPESPLVQKLLPDNRFKMVSFAQAEAYTRAFPYLTRVVLPEGAIDIQCNIPSRDIVMVAAQAAVIARDTLHPALAWPLVDALKSTHKGGGMFQRIGDFPNSEDPEFEMSEDASRIYVSGAPFFQRFLPFWLASLIERMVIMVVPIATILLPLLKLGPMLYDWRIRSRLLY